MKSPHKYTNRHCSFAFLAILLSQGNLAKEWGRGYRNAVGMQNDLNI